MREVGDKTTSELNIYKTKFNGKDVFKVDRNQNNKIDDNFLVSEGILVKRTQEDQTKWEPVTSIDKEISYEDLIKDYGIGHDGEGVLNFANGVIDSNEVSTMQDLFKEQLKDTEFDSKLNLRLNIHETVYNACLLPANSADNKYAKLVLDNNVTKVDRSIMWG